MKCCLTLQQKISKSEKCCWVWNSGRQHVCARTQGAKIKTFFSCWQGKACKISEKKLMLSSKYTFERVNRSYWCRMSYLWCCIMVIDWGKNYIWMLYQLEGQSWSTFLNRVVRYELIRKETKSDFHVDKLEGSQVIRSPTTTRSISPYIGIEFFPSVNWLICT